MGRHSDAGDQADVGSHSDSEPRFLRKHGKILIAIAALFLVPVLAITGYAVYLNSSLNNIDRLSIETSDGGRPADDLGDTFLLIGVDQGSKYPEGTPGFNIAADSKRPIWPTDKYHSDTIMIVHMSTDRRKISIVSIPRDSYVDIYDANGEKVDQKNRVNEALTKFGPSAAVKTIEQLIGIRIDHVAMIDFESFKAVTNALDRVTIHIPETVYVENSTSIAWKQGDLKLDGNTALTYVRDRKNLPNSDYSRIRRQQNFLRAILTKLKSKGTFTNPGRLKGTLDAVTKNLTVDDELKTSEIRGIAFALRKVAPSDINFVTLPIDGYSHMVGDIGSVIEPDEKKIAELVAAVRSGSVDKFLVKHPKQGLEDPSKVR